MTRLITSMLLAAASVCLASCHSTKQATHIEREETSTTEKHLQQTAAFERLRFLQGLSLDLDSFELSFPDVTIGDSVAAPLCSLPQHKRGVELKAKHATLTANSSAVHTSAKIAQHEDSTAHHSAHGKDSTEATDRTTVAKPPDTTGVFLVALLAVGAAIVVYRYFSHK